MQLCPSKTIGIAALLIVGGSAIANFIPQGARPIDGELGIDAEGRITGVLRADSESVSGQRVSIAVAIGTYATEAEEDAAIAQGTNGSKNFRIVSNPGSQNTIDLSAPWAPGVSLPLCERATLIVRSQNLQTNTVSISRHRMQKGMTTVLQARLRIPEAQGSVTLPTFAAKRPVLRLKNQWFPFVGQVGMDLGGRLVGFIRSTDDAAQLYVGFSPGRGQSLSEAVLRIENKTEGYVPFTELTGRIQLSRLSRRLTTPELVTQTAGGMIIIKEVISGELDRFTYLDVLADGKTRQMPSAAPFALNGTRLAGF